MLAKNKTSAFILSVIAFLSGFLGYLLVPDPQFVLSEWFTGGPLWLVPAAFLLAFAFAFSRWVIMGMEDDAFGWRGLLRWLAGGLLTGALLHLVAINRPAQAEDSFLLEYLFDLILPLLACGLIFWLIFRRNLFARSPSTSSNGSSLTAMRWFLIIGGALVVFAGLVFLYAIGGEVKPVLLGVGTVMMGWCGILFGALMHPGRHDSLENRLSLFSVVLTLVAFVVLVTGLLWP